MLYSVFRIRFVSIMSLLLLGMTFMMLTTECFSFMVVVPPTFTPVVQVRNKKSQQSNLVVGGTTMKLYSTKQNNQSKRDNMNTSNRIVQSEEQQQQLPQQQSLIPFMNQLVRSIVLVTTISTTTLFMAPNIASAGLLDEYGTDFKTIQPIKPIEEVTTKVVKPDAQIDPTLRGSYYYPTAKKRYLPRIQKVSNEITNVPKYLDNENWEAVIEFGKLAENAVLPLYLYQSSLDGQGLSMNSSYAKAMKADAAQYEKSYQMFEKEMKKKVRSKDTIYQTITDMAVAITDYRVQGRLSDDDGNIPSVDEMRRMAMRRPTVSINK